MTEQSLENKLMEFYSDYRIHINTLQIFTTALLNDDADEITRNQIDTMLDSITMQTNGKLEKLDEIINEFQRTYCKEN